MDCKSIHMGSIPIVASNANEGLRRESLVARVARIRGGQWWKCMSTCVVVNVSVSVPFVPHE
jgi:hypothetical protein